MNFARYLKEEDFFAKIMEIYGNSINKNNLSQYYDDLRDRIVKLTEFTVDKNVDFFREDSDKIHDFIGNLHEKHLEIQKRKKTGTFYTPNSIVKYILNATNNTIEHEIEEKKIIDISCGSGNFLIQAIFNLILRYLKINKKRYPNELSIKEINLLLDLIKKNIYGIDINPIACVLCQLNLHYFLFNCFSDNMQKDTNLKFPLFHIENKNTISTQFTDKFDIVVGNPPYIFIRDLTQVQKNLINQQNFKTAKGQYDYFQIFIEKGINILKDNGYLGYIVPDSLLALSNRKILRKFIYNSTKIKQIYHLGPQFDDPVVSNIVIILQKEINEEKRKSNKIKIFFDQNESLKNRVIRQELIEKWNYNFLIHLKSKEIKIIDELNSKFPKLKDLMHQKSSKILLARGVELTKEGHIIFCKNCNKYMPLPKNDLICNICKSPLDKNFIENIISEELPSSNREDYKLYVYSMNRYLITKYKYINIKKQGINYKNLELYKDRLIIRQLNENNLICATYERNLSLTSQSFYNLKIIKSINKEFDHLYLLGLLNSRLLSYYFIKSFGSYKKLFPRILIEKISSLPIKIPKKASEQKLCSNLRTLVNQILSLAKKGEKIEKIQNDIDRIVFALYDIKKEEQELIMKAF